MRVIPAPIIALALAAALLMPAADASAQNRQQFQNLNDRLSRLEAQIYQSGGGSPQSEAQLSLRIGQLEDQVRLLTGQVQEATFKAQQLEEQLKRFQEDTEFRFRELQGGGIAPIPDSTPLTGTPPAPTPVPDQPAIARGEQPIATPGLDSRRAGGGEVPMDTSGATGPATPPQTLGTLTLDGRAGHAAAPDSGNDGLELSGRPLDLSALAAGGGAVVPPPGVAGGEQLAVAVPNDPRAEFELGYSLIIARDYDGAERVFRQFLAQFPASALVPDARYWIGESQFQRGQFRDAADTYLAIYTEDGQSAQAAPSLLRLAQSLDRLGERDAACSTLGELAAKYPDGAPTVLDRARQERQRLGC